MAKRKPTETVQVPVRMQERLRAVLEKAAKERGEKISLNSEIVRRLEESFRQAESVAIIADIKGTLDAQKSAIEALKREVEQIIYGASNKPFVDKLEAEALTRKAELVVKARHLSGNPNMSADEALVWLATHGPARVKAKSRMLDSRRTENPTQSRTSLAQRLKDEMLAEARRLSGNPNMLFNEALVCLAKHGNAVAETILTERQHKTPFKTTKASMTRRKK